MLKKFSVVTNSWHGVNYTDTDLKSDTATESINFIGCVDGGIKKRKGIKKEPIQYTEKIHGVHIFTDGLNEKRIVHSGNKLYIGDSVIYSNMAQNTSKSVQIGGCLYILDGEYFTVYDGERVVLANESPYIPKIYTNRRPAGGGNRLEGQNIFTQWVKEGFISDGQSTQYVLSQTGLSTNEISCTVYKDDGTFYTVTNGDGVSVNTVTGIVTFQSAPPLSRATDRDNVVISYKSNTKTDIDILNKCTQIFTFGVGGAKDRLFLSGNSYYRGMVWYSDIQNPLYFSVGNAINTQMSDILGFSCYGDRLFIHSNASENTGCVGVCEWGGDKFKMINQIDGDFIFKNTIALSDTEPVFLTSTGLYAITKNRASLDNFTLARGTGLKGWLFKSKIKNAFAVCYYGAYILALDSDIFILKNESLWRLNFDIDIKFIFVEGGKLKLVSADNHIYSFYDGYIDYTNKTTPVVALWRTDKINGDNLNINKVTLQIKSENNTALKIRAIGDKKTDVKNVEPCLIGYMNFSKVIFSKFSFAPYSKNRVISKNMNLKNAKYINLEILSEYGRCHINKIEISGVK